MSFNKLIIDWVESSIGTAKDCWLVLGVVGNTATNRAVDKELAETNSSGSQRRW